MLRSSKRGEGSSKDPPRRLPRQRELILALIVAVLAFLAFRQPWLLQPLEDRTRDVRYRLRGPVAPDPRVAILAIDEPTLQRFGRLEAWPRARYGQILNRLSQAAVVGFDLMVDEPSPYPRDDELFARACRRGPPVVLSLYSRAEWQDARASGDRTSLFDPQLQQWDLAHGLSLPAAPEEPHNAYQWGIPPPDLRDAAAACGVLDVSPDSDGVYRRTRLLFGDNLGRWWPSLALAMFQQFTRTPFASVEDRRRLRQILNGPNDPARGLDFAGPPQQIPRLSVEELLESRSFHPEQLRGKLVLVAETSRGAELRPNPYSPVASGVELHANALNGLLLGRFMRAAPAGVELLLDLLLAALAACFMVGRRVWRGLASVAILAAVYTGLAQWAFVGSGLALPALEPLAAMALTTWGVLHYRLSDEELARRRLEATWQAYVGPEVLKEILNNPELSEGPGVLASVTVVLSDIRGYSGLSERLPPAEVMKQINEHFEEMTRIVFACGGAVLGVTGDGLLMVFGWPAPHSDHTDRAVFAARAIAEGLAPVNDGWAQEGRPTIDIGLGIHSGPVVAGRIGGEQGSQLTILGDVVNVANRVESLNRQLETRILMTDETRRQITLPVRLGRSESVPIRGRQEGVIVHELLHRATMRSQSETVRTSEERRFHKSSGGRDA